jgi:hypothetical protein
MGIQQETKGMEMNITKHAYTVLLVIAGLGLARPILAETVILGGGMGTVTGAGILTNLVVNVPAGQVMVVRVSSLSQGGVSISSGGVTCQPSSFDTAYRPRYLAGPCTVTYSASMNSASNTSVFNYDVVPANGIHMLLTTNAVIQVPSGQRLRMLDGSDVLSTTVTLTNGASTVFYISPLVMRGLPNGICGFDGFELAGPLTVAGSGSDFFITYFLASDVIQVVGQAIQCPAGGIDMCWSWIINPVAAKDYFKKHLVTAHANKLLPFGGDYIPVEPVLGHSIVVRRGIALALGELVDEGWLTLADALDLVNLILHGNARRIFRLPQKLEALRTAPWIK